MDARSAANDAAGKPGGGKAGGPDFVISRTLVAPRERVWAAWTERDRLMRWFGPKGFVMRRAALDLRPGGSFHYCLAAPDGKEIWGKFVYREIAPPERIVLVNSFSDARGGLARHPMNATWPLRLLSTTTFAESGGTTTMTLSWAPLDPAPEERKAFDSSHDSMRAGWTGTLDRLAAYLAQG
jgi:uncharacterized protein YndB with AHSA1/START domain